MANVINQPRAAVRGATASETDAGGWKVDPYTRLFVGVAGAMIVAGGLIAAINSAAPFAHGSWLAAYLVLVGGVAQVLLGVGPLALPAPRLLGDLRLVQLGLWNLGNAIVAAGALLDASGVVLAGSLLLLVALACFYFGGGPGRAGARVRVSLYRAAILALAASALLGAVLARTPGG
ncbi:MAG: hypothetical protein U0R71_03995 [Solirubrobacterales bacterium]